MDSKYSTLTARVKGGDGIRIYKRNRMIMTNPIATGKDPTFDTITYEWAPPGVTQKLVRELPQLSSCFPILINTSYVKCFWTSNMGWQEIKVTKMTGVAVVLALPLYHVMLKWRLSGPQFSLSMKWVEVFIWTLRGLAALLQGQSLFHLGSLLLNRR